MVEAKASEIAAKELRLRAAAESESGALLEVARKFLNECRKRLHLAEVPSASASEANVLRRQLLETAAALQVRERLLHSRRAAQSALMAIWPEREAIILADKLDDEKSRSIADQLILATNEQRDFQKSIGEIERRTKEVNDLLSSVSSCLSTLRSSIAALTSRAQEAAAVADLNSLASLLRFAHDSDADDDEILLGEVSYLQSTFGGWKATRQANDSVRTELKNLKAKLWSSLEGEGRYAVLEGVQASLKAKRRNYNLIAGPVQQLRILAPSVSNLLVHDSTCPVCSHDWESHERLMKAISDTAQIIPDDVLVLQHEISELEQWITKASQESNDQRNIAARIAELELKLSPDDATDRQYSDRIQSLGLSAESETIMGDLERVHDRVELAIATRVLQKALIDFESTLSMHLDRNVSLQEASANAIISANQLKQSAEEELANLKEQLRLERKKMSALADSTSALEVEQASLQNQVVQRRVRLNALRESWATLEGPKEYSDEALRKIGLVLLEEGSLLAGVQRDIAQATQTIDGAVQRFEMELSEKEQLSLIAEYDRLNELELAASSAQLAYHDKRVAHVREQLGGLVEVISVLFARMQSNEVYEQIVAGSDSEPLMWRAICEDQSMDPENKFSQGQRQDFALAIFLARARGLGGTFLLDEPLSHLDDLNRVALLDAFRTIALERAPGLSFVLTTANKGIVRHFAEKFALTNLDSATSEAQPTALLELLELRGNPVIGLKLGELDRVQYGASL